LVFINQEYSVIFDDIDKLASLGDKWVLSIGNFDGFHKGHRQIISTAMQKAKQLGCKMAVITFRPHPASILRPERAPELIDTFELKCKNLTDFGVDAVVAIEDSYALLNMSPEKFVDDFLTKSITPLAIVEGDNFHFGYGRSGNVRTLERLGESRGFEVICVDLCKLAFKDGLQRVSSTLVRDFLDTGRVEDASLAMGRDFRLIGKVVSGRGIGRSLGYPTANIEPLRQIIPAEGVYAGRVTIGATAEDACRGNDNIPAVYSIGRAKTFVGDTPMLIEAHLLDGSRDVKEGIYGRWLGLDFSAWIRSQRRFRDTDELRGQISKDCLKAKEILGLPG
jgi:riboflavin kinase / FMN adenylyltransferase